MEEMSAVRVRALAGVPTLTDPDTIESFPVNWILKPFAGLVMVRNVGVDVLLSFLPGVMIAELEELVPLDDLDDALEELEEEEEDDDPELELELLDLLEPLEELLEELVELAELLVLLDLEDDELVVA